MRDSDIARKQQEEIAKVQIRIKTPYLVAINSAFAGFNLNTVISNEYLLALRIALLFVVALCSFAVAVGLRQLALEEQISKDRAELLEEVFAILQRDTKK